MKQMHHHRYTDLMLYWSIHPLLADADGIAILPACAIPTYTGPSWLDDVRVTRGGITWTGD